MLMIHEVSPADFDAIWPILREAAVDEDTLVYPADIAFDDARAQWFAPGARVYNAYIGDEIIASRYIVPNKTGLGSHVCNTGIVVAKAWRGKGFGKALNAFAIGKARELGFRAIQLNLVVAENAASLHICRQNGFEIIGVLPGAFHYKRERYVDAYVMYRKL